LAGKDSQLVFFAPLQKGIPSVFGGGIARAIVETHPTLKKDRKKKRTEMPIAIGAAIIQGRKA